MEGKRKKRICISRARFPHKIPILTLHPFKRFACDETSYCACQDVSLLNIVDCPIALPIASVTLHSISKASWRTRSSQKVQLGAAAQPAAAVDRAAPGVQRRYTHILRVADFPTHARNKENKMSARSHGVCSGRHRACGFIRPFVRGDDLFHSTVTRRKDHVLCQKGRPFAKRDAHGGDVLQRCSFDVGLCVGQEPEGIRNPRFEIHPS